MNKRIDLSDVREAVINYLQHVITDEEGKLIGREDAEKTYYTLVSWELEQDD